MAKPTAWYGEWFDSLYYQLLYRNRDEVEARVLVENLLQELRLPATSRVVDLGCGRGRHAVILHEHGLDVTGLDLSVASIHEAKKLQTPSLQFGVHNIHFPYRDNYFQAAFNFFTSFGYDEEDADNVRVITAASQSLVAQGYFVLDYLNPEILDWDVKEPEELILEGVRLIITRWRSAHFVYKRILVNEGSEEYCFEERVRLYSLNQLQQFFHAAGFVVVNVWGDYNLNTYNSQHSARMILLGKKISA
ncbi:MAG: methyltransferase domain-containing protein [Flammeovirgaceae bacterium]